jgi:hypothetical protein
MVPGLARLSVLRNGLLKMGPRPPNSPQVWRATQRVTERQISELRLTWRDDGIDLEVAASRQAAKRGVQRDTTSAKAKHERLAGVGGLWRRWSRARRKRTTAHRLTERPKKVFGAPGPLPPAVVWLARVGGGGVRAAFLREAPARRHCRSIPIPRMDGLQSGNKDMSQRYRPAAPRSRSYGHSSH